MGIDAYRRISFETKVHINITLSAKFNIGMEIKSIVFPVLRVLFKNKALVLKMADNRHPEIIG